jgi:hypothetical protein
MAVTDLRARTLSLVSDGRVHAQLGIQGALTPEEVDPADSCVVPPQGSMVLAAYSFSFLLFLRVSSLRPGFGPST